MSESTPKRKPGRPVTTGRAGGGNTPVTVRLPPEVREMVMALGGGRWVRGLIDKALAEK